MRLFFGIPVDEATGLALLDERDQAMTTLASARPRAVPASNFHLTLVFLGDIPEQRVDRLRECGDQVARQVAAGAIRLERACCFPDSKARLFAVEGQADPHVHALHDALKASLMAVGFPVEQRRFRPHVTLARLACSYIPGPQWPLTLQMPVTHFALYESVQRTQGPRYRMLQHWVLERE